jgi:hypothetical protein
MKKQVPTVIEIDALAPSTLTRLTSGASQSRLMTETILRCRRPRGRAALRRFIDSFALASCGMAGVYVSVWLDEPIVPGDQISGIDETSPRQRGVAATRHDADGWPF